MAQKLLNSDLAELISKMKLAQQYVMTRWGPARCKYFTHSRCFLLFYVESNYTSCVCSAQFTKGLQETDANGSSRSGGRRQEPAGRHRPITTQDDQPDPPTVVLDPGTPKSAVEASGSVHGLFVGYLRRINENKGQMCGQQTWLKQSAVIFSSEKHPPLPFFLETLAFWSTLVFSTLFWRDTEKHHRRSENLRKQTKTKDLKDVTKKVELKPCWKGQWRCFVIF